jgi:hypothetical protein
VSIAPQSGDDVRLVVEDLQRLDRQLDVRWEPRAVMVKRGSYSASGQIVDPVYEGRWRVIHYDTSVQTATWRPFTHICYVTEPVEVGSGLKAMSADGPYAPLGPWLVEFFRQADRHNQEGARRLREKLDAMNDASDEAALAAGDDAIEEAASKQYHAGTKAGGGVSEFHPVGIDLRH